MLASLLSGEFLLHIPCWLCFSVGSFFYTSQAGLFFCFIFLIIILFFLIWGVSLTHPVLASFLSREFLLHIPCCLHFYLASFSHTSHAAFSFLWGVSLTHPMLASFFNLGSFSYTSHAGIFIYFLIWGVSLTHPVLTLFLCGVCLTHPVLY